MDSPQRVEVQGNDPHTLLSLNKCSTTRAISQSLDLHLHLIESLVNHLHNVVSV
jgi:hypothetical protein